MKSKLQNGDVCKCVDGSKGSVKQAWIKRGFGEPDLSLGFYTEDLTRTDHCRKFDIIRVTRNNEIIWQRDESVQPQAVKFLDINKMMTATKNGETIILPMHENMQVLVEKISELIVKVSQLEAEISNLKQSR